MDGQLEDYKIILEELEGLVQAVYEEVKSKSDQNEKKTKNSNPIGDTIPYKADFVLFTLLESLIFNLYTKHKNVERTRLNSSIYSQGSVWSGKTNSRSNMMDSFNINNNHSLATTQDMGKFLEFMNNLIMNKTFFAYLANLLEENENQGKRKFVNNKKNLNEFFNYKSIIKTIF